MRRLALPFTLLCTACGEDPVSTGSGFTSNGDATSTSTGPITTGDESTSTTSTPTSSASDSGTTTTSATSSTTDATTATTTEAIDPSTTTTTTDQTTTSTTTSDTTTTTTTTDSTTTTSDDTTTGSIETGDDPNPVGICQQGMLTTFITPMPQPSELHIIGVYQATGNNLTVTVTRIGVPLTLFLSSYEPVAFTLDLAPGVQLERVILNGYNMHTVQGQGGALLTDLSAKFGDPNWNACGYFWPMNDQGCDTPKNVTSAEALTGLELTTYAGCYEASSFTLD